MRTRQSVESVIGRRFGCWTILRLARLDSRRNRIWICRCDCGTEREVWQTNLYSGLSFSCGCRKGERIAAALRKYHAPTATIAEYGIWLRMRQRCTNPADTSYARYGGRGIRVCRSWDESFDEFYRDMGSRPSPEHSLERVNNDGDYAPDNCCWILLGEQARNKRSTRILRCGDIIGSAVAWSEVFGVSSSTLCYRISRGWSVYDALTRAVAHRSGRPRKIRPCELEAEL